MIILIESKLFRTFILAIQNIFEELEDEHMRDNIATNVVNVFRFIRSAILEFAIIQDVMANIFCGIVLEGVEC